MTHSTVAGCLLFACTLGAAVLSGHDQRQPPQSSTKHDTLTTEQKQRLAQHFKAAFGRRTAERRQASTRLNASGVQFLASERQKVQAQNASIRGAIASLSSGGTNARFDAIEREARELSKRAATATGAEREAIDRRAAQLLSELLGGKPPGR
jgi:hypothetical protein